MTVSANYSLDFTRDQLIRMAYQLTGTLMAGKEPSAAEIGMASDFLNLELMNLQAEGVVLRTVERTTKAFADGTGSYALDADTIDVHVGPNDEIGAVTGSSGTATPVYVMSRDEYLNLPQTTQEGRPSRIYIEKLATVTAYPWPVPDGAYTWRYARVRLLRDADTGAVTMDVARRWLQAVAYSIAAQIALARNLPLDKTGYLRSEAERMKAICRGDDVQRGAIQLRVTHRGRNW